MAQRKTASSTTQLGTDASVSKQATTVSNKVAPTKGPVTSKPATGKSSMPRRTGKRGR